MPQVGPGSITQDMGPSYTPTPPFPEPKNLEEEYANYYYYTVTLPQEQAQFEFQQSQEINRGLQQEYPDGSGGTPGANFSPEAALQQYNQLQEQQQYYNNLRNQIRNSPAFREAYDALFAGGAPTQAEIDAFNEQMGLTQINEQATILAEQAAYYYNIWAQSQTAPTALAQNSEQQAQAMAEWIRGQFGNQPLPPWIEEYLTSIGTPTQGSVTNLATRDIPAGYFGPEYQGWMDLFGIPKIENQYGTYAGLSKVPLASGQTMSKLTPSQLEGLGGYIDWASGKAPGAYASFADYLNAAQSQLPTRAPVGTRSWAPSWGL